jgi:hypothetical protein
MSSERTSSVSVTHARWNQTPLGHARAPTYHYHHTTPAANGGPAGRRQQRRRGYPKAWPCIGPRGERTNASREHGCMMRPCAQRASFSLRAIIVSTGSIGRSDPMPNHACLSFFLSLLLVHPTRPRPCLPLLPSSWLPGPAAPPSSSACRS